MLRVLLNRFHPDDAQAFLKGLPQETIKAVLGQAVQSKDTLPIFTFAEEVIKKIHYSWLIPCLKNLPLELRPMVMCSLPQAQALRLSKFTGLSIPKVTLTPLGKQFLFNLFYKQVPTQDVLPFEYLPASNLNTLTTFTKNELVEAIDLLGIFDLAEEIRYIVDKNTLKYLYGCLDTKKQQFLRICLHQKEKVIAPRLKLDNWHGDCAKLKVQLHQRGLVRLSKALCGQHTSLLWYVTHILDTGRGEIISKHYRVEEIKGVTQALVLQVINTINFLNKKSGS